MRLHGIFKQSQTRKEALGLSRLGADFTACWEPECEQKRYDKTTLKEGSPPGPLQGRGTFSHKSPPGPLCRTGDRAPPGARCEVLPFQGDRHLQTHTVSSAPPVSRTCTCDAGAQLTFKSIRDEFNGEQDGSATGNGLGIQVDLRGRGEKRRGRRGSRQGGRGVKGRGERGGGAREDEGYRRA